MLKLKPTLKAPEGLAQALYEILKNHSNIRRAYFAEVALTHEANATPAILIEWNEPFDRNLAQLLSNAAEPFFRNGCFNVAPVPSGPHWTEIVKTSVPILERNSPH